MITLNCHSGTFFGVDGGTHRSGSVCLHCSYSTGKRVGRASQILPGRCEPVALGPGRNVTGSRGLPEKPFQPSSKSSTNNARVRTKELGYSLVRGAIGLTKVQSVVTARKHTQPSGRAENIDILIPELLQK